MQMDSHVDLLTALKTIGRLQVNDKLSTRAAHISIQPPHLTHGLTRWWYNESREHNLDVVRRILQSAFSEADAHLTRLENPQSVRFLERLRDELLGVQQGLQILCHTYNRCSQTSSKLMVFIENVKTVYARIATTLPVKPEHTAVDITSPQPIPMSASRNPNNPHNPHNLSVADVAMHSWGSHASVDNDFRAGSMHSVGSQNSGLFNGSPPVVNHTAVQRQLRAESSHATNQSVGKKRVGKQSVGKQSVGKQSVVKVRNSPKPTESNQHFVLHGDDSSDGGNNSKGDDDGDDGDDGDDSDGGYDSESYSIVSTDQENET